MWRLDRRLLCLAGLLLAFSSARVDAAIITDFTGIYDVSNWTAITNAGSISTAGAPFSISLTSADDGSNTQKDQDFFTTAAGDGIVRFDWAWTGTDFLPSFDPFGYLLNDTFTSVTGFAYGTGMTSFEVSAGDVFGFRQRSLDSLFGSATTVITNFEAPVGETTAVVPEPATFCLLGAGLVAGGLRRRWRFR